MNYKLLDCIYLFSPLVFSYLTKFICPIDKNAGKLLKFRPPSWVFGVVWPILFIFLGISFMFNMRRNNSLLTFSLYVLLIISFSLWMYFYNCKNNKRIALLVLLFSFGLSLGCFSVSYTTTKLLLCPLITWLLFAILMNKTEVQNN